MKKAGIGLGLLLLAGCGVEPEEGLPIKVVYTEEENESPAAAEDNMMAELYVADQNGLLVPQAVSIPAEENAEKAALQALAAGTVPEGFTSPLPEGTVIQNVEVEGKTATVSLGGSFSDYPAEEELLVASAITWTVTGMGQAERVQVKLNGEKLDAMPKAGLPIAAGGMKREDGINMKADYAHTGATKPLTVFYTAQNEQGPYFVPVTRRIPAETTDIISAAVSELAKGPVPGSGLMTTWPADAAVTGTPSVQKGQASLQLNESVLENNGEALVSSQLLKPLALTLAASANIESISITVDGHPDVKMETGEPLPVSLTAPLFVNAESQVTAE